MTWFKKAICAIVAASLAAAFLCLTPNLASADLESDLAAAEQRLSELGSELSSMQADLEAATEQLEETDNQIGEMEIEIANTQEELDQLRQVLASRMRSGYKAGTADVLDFILGSTSVDDFLSRVYYMDKVSENDAATIARVLQLKFDLEQQKSELETEKAEQEVRVSDMEAQVAEYESAVAEAEAYYNSLDQQLQEELARRAEEERRAAEAAAAEQAAAEAQQPSGMATAIEAIQTSEQVQQTTASTSTQSETTSTESTSTTSSTSESTTTSETTSTSTTTTESESTSSSSSSSSSSASTGSVPAPGGGLATAYACLGYPYIWGACGYTGDGRFGFDCGGLVYYCYLGYRAGTAGTIGRAIQANGTWVTSMDQLNVGDCVFTAPGFNHIGIYIGNGQMIHAPNSSKPVMIGPVYAFYGGGPFAT